VKEVDISYVNIEAELRVLYLGERMDVKSMPWQSFAVVIRDGR
jgi:hypothetical protein